MYETIVAFLFAISGMAKHDGCSAEVRAAVRAPHGWAPVVPIYNVNQIGKHDIPTLTEKELADVSAVARREKPDVRNNLSFTWACDNGHEQFVVLDRRELPDAKNASGASLPHILNFGNDALFVYDPSGNDVMGVP